MGVNAKRDCVIFDSERSPHDDFKPTEIFLVLSQRGMRISSCWVNVELDFLKAESTRNKIFLVLS